MLEIIAAVAALLFTPAEAAQCVPYGTVVTLAGRYAPVIMAESSTRNSDPRGIPSRTADLIVLDVPLCVATDVVSRGVAAAMDLQLSCPDLVAERGERVSITGRLVGAHTGNGHTPILLVCPTGSKTE